MKHRRPRRGAMLVLVAVMLIIVLIMAVFSVDVARMQLARTQLRSATDAAAHAATESLTRTQNPAQARIAAEQIALQNGVAGKGLQLDTSDLIFGRAVPAGGAFTFVPNRSPFNAVRVRGRRTDDSLDGAVPLFLGGILGRETFEPVIECSSLSTTRDIALVLDRSGSMSGQKIDDLKTAVGVFLDVLDTTLADERVSLSTYATTGSKNVDMTSNLNSVRTEVNAMNASGYTAIGQGLQLGSDSLDFDANSRAFAEKTIVLMTDGIENRSPFVAAVLPTVIARGHTCYTVSFGSGANQTLMIDVADQTGGEHYHAPNGAALQAIFEEIATTLAVVMFE